MTKYAHFGVSDVPVKRDVIAGSAVGGTTVSYGNTSKKTQLWSNGGRVFATIGTQQVRIPANSSVILCVEKQTESFTVQSASGKPGRLYYVVEW